MFDRIGYRVYCWIIDRRDARYLAKHGYPRTWTSPSGQKYARLPRKAK